MKIVSHPKAKLDLSSYYQRHNQQAMPNSLSSPALAAQALSGIKFYDYVI